MTTMRVSHLAKYLGLSQPEASDDPRVTGVSQDHRRVRPGDVFIASQGAKSHGAEFADQAISAGAVAIISDRVDERWPIAVFKIDSPKSLIGDVCNLVYGPVTARVWGVTGTNGKTSSTTFLYRLLTELGEVAALSGSTGFTPALGTINDGLTTPEADVLHRQIRDWEKHGVTDVVLEVSAQALVRHRVAGIRFHMAGFTNLSHDHLDEFGSLENYFAAKATLFTDQLSDRAVITVDDEFGSKLFAAATIPKASLSCEVERAGSVDYGLELDRGFRIKSRTAGMISAAQHPGELMSKNLALATAMLLESGYSADDVNRAIGKIDLNVQGRLQKINSETKNRPTVFLDYAHTPEAIRLAVSELRSQGFAQVSIVFSASGDRDHSKRPDMARAAATADLAVVTDFHPRSEDPASIRAELVAELTKTSANFLNIADPALAIAEAIRLSSNGSAVLWCGPGHLNYREVGGKKIPFDPVSIIRTALEEIN